MCWYAAEVLRSVSTSALRLVQVEYIGKKRREEQNQLKSPVSISVDVPGAVHGALPATSSSLLLAPAAVDPVAGRGRGAI